MIVPYTELPEVAGGWPVPLLDVVVADIEDMRLPCLVDSGAVHTLLPQWVAEAGGISLNGLKSRRLAVAGMGTEAVFVTTRLAAATYTWEGEVGFCQPWPYGWGLLGQLSFFRFFTVILRAIDFEFELEPI